MRAANKANAPTADIDDKGRRADAAARARRLARLNADTMPVVAPIEGPKVEREVHAELISPAPRGGLFEVFQNPYLLRLIVTRELASMYAASLLGLLWSYIQPAMRFAVYYVVMGVILKLHQGFPNFAIHLFCGIVFVHYFTETWSGSTRSIWQNRSLVIKMRLPREVFPVASMVVAFYHTFPQVLLLAFCCLIAGWHLSMTGVVAALLGMAILMLFAMAMSLFFSALNVFFRDFQNIVQTMLQFLHFLVPMMYPFSRVYIQRPNHELLYQLYMANPIAEAVILMQRFFWWGVVPDTAKDGNSLINNSTGARTVQFPPDMWVRGLIMLALLAVLVYLAQKFFSRVEGKFPERM
jgi:ABC-2 type transport system permease protein